MISSGVLCTISVFVSNLCCLALSSFFSSILPSKRNLLTQLNTVLVFVLTAMVNVMVRWNKSYSDSKSSFEKSSSRCNFFQCGTSLISATCQLSTPLAIILQLILFWLSSLLQGVLVALSLTRMFLIFKVNKKQEKNSLNCIQPTEFNQLDHERRFKLVFFCLLTGNTIFSLAALSLNNLLAEGQG